MLSFKHQTSATRQFCFASYAKLIITKLLILCTECEQTDSDLAILKFLKYVP